MRSLLLVAISTFLVGCGSLPSASAVGEGLQNAERALCPMQTAKNLDNTLDNILALIPLIAWEPVCPDG
jgi:uncharacterized protein YceK